MVKYDAFISYAVEDREAAEKIYEYLESKGLSVFYLRRNLEVGDDIAEAIYKGLERSRYGIVILSPDYKRLWPSNESGLLRNKEYSRKAAQVFPVWHNIDYTEVAARFPWLEGRFAVSTQEGFDTVGEKLFTAITKRVKESRLSMIAKCALILSIVAGLAVYFFHGSAKATAPGSLPGNEAIDIAIRQRIQSSELEWKVSLEKNCGSRPVTIDSVTRWYSDFVKLSEEDYERNQYRFTSGYVDAGSKKSIQLLGLPVFTSPYSAYGMKKFSICLVDTCAHSSMFNYCYVISNSEPVEPVVDTVVAVGAGEAIVRVSYSNFIRFVKETLRFNDPIELKQQFIMGMKPEEEYVFELRKGKWEHVRMN